MNIVKQYLKTGHRVRPQGVFKKTSITIHSTGNPTSTAQNERNWLDNPTNNRDASWHYVVDEKEIIQAIPDIEAAWHCGNQTGNRQSIGIEICESGNREKTLEHAAEFTAAKLQELRLHITDLKKHYDWTKKDCPRILINSSFIKDNMDWSYFVTRVQFYLEGEKEMEKRLQTIEEIPEWGRKIIQKLIDKGGFADPRKLDLSYDMLRIFVILDRYNM